jgi:hypothetical protein
MTTGKASQGTPEVPITTTQTGTGLTVECEQHGLIAVLPTGAQLLVPTVVAEHNATVEHTTPEVTDESENAE